MNENDLRDYFAGRAMQGIVTGEFSDGCSGFVAVGIAQDAYTIADAMMKVRDPKWVEDFSEYE